jgi:hypothetical protein
VVPGDRAGSATARIARPDLARGRVRRLRAERTSPIFVVSHVRSSAPTSFCCAAHAPTPSGTSVASRTTRRCARVGVGAPPPPPSRARPPPPPPPLPSLSFEQLPGNGLSRVPRQTPAHRGRGCHIFPGCTRKPVSVLVVWDERHPFFAWLFSCGRAPGPCAQTTRQCILFHLVLAEDSARHSSWGWHQAGTAWSGPVYVSG